MPKASLKPVAVDVQLDYHEKLLQSVGDGIQDTKRRLHDTDLMLSLEPPLYDELEWSKWDKTVRDMINEKKRQVFPDLTKMRKDYEMRNLVNKQNEMLKKAQARDVFMKTVERIQSRRSARVKEEEVKLKRKGAFGSEPPGEELKTIHNYNGCNSIFSNNRTLIRKSGKMGSDDTNSSLPPWIGPMYYSQPELRLGMSDRYYQIPFKSGSYKREMIMKRRNDSRRRQELKEISNNPKASDSQPRSSSYFKEVLEFSSDSGEEEVSGKTKPTRKSLGNMKEKMREARKSVIRRSAGSSILSRSLVHNDLFSLLSAGDFGIATAGEFSRPATATASESDASHSEISRSSQTSPENVSRINSPSEIPSDFRRLETVPSMSRCNSPSGSTVVSEAKRSPASPVQLSAAQRRNSKKRRNINLNPLSLYVGYEMKVLDAEKNLKRNSKDYCMRGLDNQGKLVLNSFDMIEKESSSANTPKSSTPSSNLPRSNEVGGKFTSDIFKSSATIDYRTTEQLQKESAVRANAHELITDPFAERKKQRDLNATLRLSKPKFSPAPFPPKLTREEIQKRKSSETLRIYGFPREKITNRMVLGSSGLPLTLPSNYLVESLMNSTEDKDALQSEISEMKKGKVSSPYRLEMSSKEISQGGDNVARVIDRWYDQGNIQRTNHRSRGYSDDFVIKKHEPVDLSLTGLLLSEEPSESHPELVELARDRDMDEIALFL